jgi:hypothetical protein
MLNSPQESLKDAEPFRPRIRLISNRQTHLSNKIDRTSSACLSTYLYCTLSRNGGVGVAPFSTLSTPILWSETGWGFWAQKSNIRNHTGHAILTTLTIFTAHTAHTVYMTHTRRGDINYGSIRGVVSGAVERVGSLVLHEDGGRSRYAPLIHEISLLLKRDSRSS